MYNLIAQWIVLKKYNNQVLNVPPEECISEIIYDDNQYCIIKKKLCNKHIELYITYKRELETNDFIFVRGFLYKNNEEIKIMSVVVFESLQIGVNCYDKIAICDYL